MNKVAKGESALDESSTVSSEASLSSEASSITSPVPVEKKPKSKSGSRQNDPQTKKKRKAKKSLSICISNCRYEVIRRVAKKFNLKEVGENDKWNLFWTDYTVSIERCKEMKRFQRINHFPAMLEICRKDLLARNLNRMLKVFPKDYNFFPKTWCLPADLGDALNYSRIRKNKTFILKPDTGSQGKGIFITKSLKDIKPTERLICQVYISRPYLIDGYKFDLRIYVLITSCDPLRIYVYDEGLVRFATSRYQEPTGDNSTNVFMHLTNYAVNKHSRTFSIDDECGSKRKLSWFNNYMRALGHDVTRLWHRIDDVIIKTLFSALLILRHSYHACFPNHDLVPACCELLGMDIILDRHLSPQLLEVNHSPSFHTDTVLDKEVKDNLLTDMFNMLNLDQCDKRKVIREDRRRVQERLIRGHQKENEPNTTSNKNSFAEYYRHEMANRGGYRLIYPDSRTEHQYMKYMRQTQSSVYSNTACSNARQIAAAALRDEMQMKAKEEAARRMNGTHKPKKSSDTPPSKLPNFYELRPSSTCCSFEPETINESEEKDRLVNMAHRDFLVKSYGIADHVYFLLKKNNVLRPADERRYNQKKNANQNKAQTERIVEKNEKHMPRPNIRNFLDIECLKSDAIKCGSSYLHSRPDRPVTWDGTNKTDVVRTLSNTAKINANFTREERNMKKTNCLVK